jgi:hypothetical protein
MKSFWSRNMPKVIILVGQFGLMKLDGPRSRYWAGSQSSDEAFNLLSFSANTTRAGKASSQHLRPAAIDRLINHRLLPKYKIGLHAFWARLRQYRDRISALNTD